MKSLPFVFALTMFFALGGSGGAQDMPTVDALRAKIVAASGTPPPSSYEQISYTQYGATGTRTIVRSGEDERETSTLSQLRTARGTYRARL